MRKKRKKTRRIVIPVISGAALILMLAAAIYIGYIYKYAKNWEGLIYPGITIADIDMGGKTREEAIELLKSKYGDVLLKKKITIKTDAKSYEIDYARLNARYNISEQADEAFRFGKDLNFFKKYDMIKEPEEKLLELSFAYNGKYIKDVIAAIEKDVNKEPVNGAIEMVSSGKFKVTPDIKGYKLLSENLEKEINSKINGELSGDITIKAPIEELRAKLTQELLASIDTKVSSFITNFATSSGDRANNIELATKAINGKLLMPGDTFSFNEIVGQRTAERGYKSAPVIIGFKVEQDFGGGICQVSSTLYNAVLRMGLKSAERVHHTLTSTYVLPGMDATVDWGNLDYKFTNTLEFPIYLEGFSTIKRELVFNIYTNSSIGNKTYKVWNEVYQTVQPQVKYEDDPSLPVGETRVIQQAIVGQKVKVYRATYENNVQISQEVISDDYYKPVDGKIKRGTKK